MTSLAVRLFFLKMNSRPSFWLRISESQNLKISKSQNPKSLSLNLRVSKSENLRISNFQNLREPDERALRSEIITPTYARARIPIESGDHDIKYTQVLSGLLERAR